ncbi:imidazole glycerol phosphate synthase, glutamine amidotransferase subunit [Catonella morbi ATCC 51271]|uniref:Imidazole glycerol phosphate synthase subunit HisH n=1 Tax=Catonella morbi ATCC 51271 TaxID=592026 RepID=V2ZA76_9FIRM|nr:imidazole glycerol phosphate synthase subunit HisH [Catonella morbi]ESL03830.1 imidazole glycerol phosphate synthase, glutamine amidotransferase subunit [Catonella morbi ATCC 51271]
MTVIIDYGVGNLFSLVSSLKKIGEEAIISSDKDIISQADRIILPGVGAFGDAIAKLNGSGLSDIIMEDVSKGKPLLGICLGMQLLFEKSFEYGENKGLGLIKGEIRALSEVIPNNLKIPHMGWNGLHFKKKSPIFEGLAEGDEVYFVHSFAGFYCEESLIATAEYSVEVTAAVNNKNVYGVQFHPEKSGEKGFKILKNFCRL